MTLVTIFAIPYFVLPQTNKKEEKAKEENFQKFIKERIAKRNTEKKIYLTGHFYPAQKEDFALVPEKYSVAGYPMYLRKEPLGAFLEMAKAANLDKIDLKIVSATRNFNYQKGIWEKKWVGTSAVDGLNKFKKILEYSAVPGTSRHHWGTEIDINGVNPAYFDTEEGHAIYLWLAENAMRFGFCQTYNLKGAERPTGYNEEKWHWSYLPLARTFTQEYKNLVKDEDIKGFDGDNHVPELDLVNNYVLSINPACI